MRKGITFRLYWFLCFLSLFILFGCGDIEEEKTTEAVETVEAVDVEAELSKAADLPDDWYRSLEIPDDWYEAEDPDLRNDYFYAILLRQFGDIPEVHILVGYQRKRDNGLPTTFDERTAFLTAQARLWPSEQNDKVLENRKKLKEQLTTEDPERFAELFREDLVDRFGEGPEVDILVRVEKKWKAGGAVTDAEYLVYLQARQGLFPNEQTLDEIEELLNEQAER